MKNIVCWCLALLPGFAYGQIGLGLGSQGLVAKSSPDTKYGVIGRLNIGLGAGAALRPQVNLVGRMVNEPNAKLYAGVGAGFSILVDPSAVDACEYFLMCAPIGVEYFPFQTRLFSVTVETGLEYFISDNRFNNRDNLQFGGLIELTFYIDNKRR